MALKLIGVIPRIPNEISQEYFDRMVAQAELPRLSEALWRELRYLGHTEQMILKLERDIKADIKRQRDGELQTNSR